MLTQPYTHRAIHHNYEGLTHCHTGNTPGRYLWFKNSIVTSSCHVYLKTIEGYRMLQRMYIYTSWVVLSVWYYIIDYILLWAQCGGENFTIGPLPTRNRLREKLSVRPTGSFTTVVALALEPRLGNSNPELQLGCSTVSTGLGMIMRFHFDWSHNPQRKSRPCCKVKKAGAYKGLLVIEQRSCYKVIVRRSVETPKFCFILKYTTIQNATYTPKGGVSINRNIPNL